MNDHSRPPQNATVLRLLRERGSVGITAYELLGYGIYRAGARVYELRKAGHTITTENAHGKTARYRLTPPRPVQAVLFDEVRT